MRDGEATEKLMHQLVTYYLKQKNYSQAEAALNREAASQSNGDDTPSAESLRNIALFYQNFELFCANHNISTAHALGENEATRPEECYIKIRDWIQRALDMYKPELYAFLYPLYIYMFLHLLKLNCFPEAKAFFDAHYKEHEALHKEELDQLVYISSLQHLNENKFAQGYIKGQYKIQISREGLDLLLSFIVENRVLLVLRMLTKHFDIETVKMNPDDTSVFFRRFGDSERSRSREIPHRWPKPFEALIAEKYEEFYDEEGTAHIQKKFRTEKPAEDSIPLPELPEETEASIIIDIHKRVSVSAKAMPSVCFHTFFNTRSSLICATASADGANIAAGFEDSSIKFWSPGDQNLGENSAENSKDNLSRNGAAIASRLGHSGSVYSLCYSQDSTFLLSCSEDATVRLWHQEMQSNLASYKGHNYPIWDVAFSPLGLYFASASADSTARLWTSERPAALRIFAGHFSDVDCVTFHPNCNYIATGSSDQSIRMWDIQNGDCVRIFSGHISPINCLDISPDGKYLASGGEKGEVLLWDIASSRVVSILGFHAKNTAVNKLSFSAGDGAVLVSGGQDCTVRLWDVRGATTTPSEISSSFSSYLPEAISANADKPSPNALSVFRTKQTPVAFVQFTRTNLLLAGGAFISA